MTSRCCEGKWSCCHCCGGDLAERAARTLRRVGSMDDSWNDGWSAGNEPIWMDIKGVLKLFLDVFFFARTLKLLYFLELVDRQDSFWNMFLMTFWSRTWGTLEAQHWSNMSWAAAKVHAASLAPARKPRVGWQAVFLQDILKMFYAFWSWICMDLCWIKGDSKYFLPWDASSICFPTITKATKKTPT